MSLPAVANGATYLWHSHLFCIFILCTETIRKLSAGQRMPPSRSTTIRRVELRCATAAEGNLHGTLFSCMASVAKKSVEVVGMRKAHATAAVESLKDSTTAQFAAVVMSQLAQNQYQQEWQESCPLSRACLPRNASPSTAIITTAMTKIPPGQSACSHAVCFFFPDARLSPRTQIFS